MTNPQNTPPASEADVIATVAYASACLMLRKMFGHLSPEQQAALLVNAVPFFEGCALATRDAFSNWHPKCEPSPN